AQYGKFNSNAANGGYLTFESSGTVHGDIGTAAQIVSGGSASDFGINARGARNLILGTNNAERLRVTSGGEVYIAGTTDQGAYNLQVNGTGVWGAGAYVNGSDSRIKEDIQPLTSGLDVVEKLNPVTYKYKETWSSDQSIQSGFIAQELLTALDGQIYASGVVQQGGAEGYYSVAYQNLIAVLTKAIQELKAENESLKTRVSALEAA
ncbi:MAG: tail fiber domain-containing protein, partial [Caulobacteraceae bacterium]|nr:tail fiber domain-containing protein [Caulobacteraceae bacterium]